MPKGFHDERITCNRKSRGAPPSNFRGDGDGGNGGRGGGFSSPANNETVRVVNGKAYAACKYCVCNSGNCAQTSVGHELSRMSGYSVTFALKTKMNKILGAADGVSCGDSTNDSGGGNGDVNSFAAKMMER